MADTAETTSVATVSATRIPSVTANQDLGEITKKTLYEINEPYIFGGGFIVLVRRGATDDHRLWRRRIGQGDPDFPFVCVSLHLQYLCRREGGRSASGQRGAIDGRQAAAHLPQGHRP